MGFNPEGGSRDGVVGKRAQPSLLFSSQAVHSSRSESGLGGGRLGSRSPGGLATPLLLGPCSKILPNKRQKGTDRCLLERH